ncbi:hypothetical protein [Rhodococcus sp. H29-C3]|uniref:hypothetical protein n=1 Tax=Rhodococcus sp. H29-C3 TaxID=3046307 RepID=UPI0024B8B898|nr:hypothetical protein [Rhodococcus sp. H29-C3]MDJ0361885.1 hypothetical protein [Rhodococcus sp. H29-C3]
MSASLPRFTASTRASPTAPARSPTALRIVAGTRVFQRHSTGRGPLWLANAGYGRFDLAGDHGTCYIAQPPQITLLETWGGMRVMPTT